MLSLGAQKNILFQVVENTHRLRNGLSKKVYEHVEMIAKELLMESGRQAKGIFHMEKRVKMNSLHALVENASTTALQDFHVALSIAGVGVVHVQVSSN
jgi:hypothetical protein